MALLYLSDILKRAKLDLSEVLLIRYGLSNKLFEKYYVSKRLKEYTQIQRKNDFPEGDYKYWITFIGNGGNSALLLKCYKITKSVQNVAYSDFNDTIKEIIQAKCKKNEPVYFDIKESDLLNDFENRLIIDWGKNHWYQVAENEKDIIAIWPKQKKKFEGYENLILTYEELREIVKDKLTYADWYTALSSIYAIYLIVDKTDGRQYVGSAYGEGGLFDRWSKYVETKHGKNSEMKELLKDDPERYKAFQFSILRYKEKLLTKEFGLNDN